ncbi:hypothetical protein AYI70_g5376 [Smittium culicis]|uniref:Uncharacterized protein n=1 Tax=Smittium culicis TaxID=133412 RepID=A0A1R1XUW0_9FUNG|nr:hypothetical protein AYI70_g5376 [Smittium culicis]
MDTFEEPEILLSRTMRTLLSEIAAKVTQARLDNLNKYLKPTGKPTQLVESDFKPLMDQEALDSLISKKPTTKRQRIQPFFMRQQSTILKDTDSSNTAKASRTASETTAEASHKTHYPQSIFRGRAEGARILQPDVDDTEEYWRSPTRPGPAEAKSASGRTELQDEDADILLQNDLNGRSFQFGALSFGLSLSSLIFTKILRLVIEWNRSKGIRAPEYLDEFLIIWVIQRRVPIKHALNLLQALIAWVQSQFREIVEYAVSVDRTPCNGDQNVGNVTQGSVYQDPESPTRSQKIFQCCHSASCETDATPNIRAQEQIALIQVYGTTRWRDCIKHKGTVYSVVCTQAQDGGGGEQEAGSILKLVPRQKSAGTECPDPQFDNIRQSVLLYTLESIDPGSSEGPPRASHNDSSDTNVEIHDLVSRPDATVNFTATPSSSNNCSSGSKKRKVTALGKQALRLDFL